MVRIQQKIYTEDLENHIIIYGWNPHYKVLLEELRGEGLRERVPILIVSLGEKIQTEEMGSSVYILDDAGDYEANLLAANIKKADKLIISSNLRESKNARDVDANAILICLFARKMHPDIWVIVDIPFGNDIEHLLNAGVDDVICGEQFCSMITASAIVNEGISPFFREILSTRYGNEFYAVKFGPHFHDKTFLGTLEDLKEKKNALLLAIVRGKKIYTNPQFLSIEKEDIGIVLAESKLDEL